MKDQADLTGPHYFLQDKHTIGWRLSPDLNFWVMTENITI